jgi:hypothetical protein
VRNLPEPKFPQSILAQSNVINVGRAAGLGLTEYRPQILGRDADVIQVLFELAQALARVKLLWLLVRECAAKT